MRMRSLWIAALVVGIAVASGWTALAQHGHGHHGQPQEKEQAHKDPAATQPAGCPMCMMSMGHMKSMGELKQLLADAEAALDAGDVETASAKIGEAQALLDKQHQQMHTHMQKMMKKQQEAHKGKAEKMHGKAGAGMARACPMCGMMMGAEDAPGKVVNSRCPIMGSKIDPENVPANLTRTFNGKKVGFCCAACPAKWDTLSDQEKAKKLQGAMGG